MSASLLADILPRLKECAQKTIELNLPMRKAKAAKLREKRLASVKRTRAKDPGAYRKRDRLRQQERAKAMQGPAAKEADDYAAWLKAQPDVPCAYCREPLIKAGIDHLVALSNGGLHEPMNLVPCCKSCNSMKSAKGLWCVPVVPHRFTVATWRASLIPQ